MIFSIPRSKSQLEQYSYLKNKRLNETNYYLLNQNKYIQPNKGSQEITKKKSSDLFHQFKSKDLQKGFKNSNIQHKQFIYNKKKSRSYDKYFLETKKKTNESHKSVQLKQKSLHFSQKSQDKFNILYGKKLIDPIHQKFNYFIKNTKQQTSPFVISDFLLQPCKIKTKKLQVRPFTSQIFIPIQSENLVDKKVGERKNSTQSSFSKKFPNSSRPHYQKKDHKIFMEFSKQLYNSKNLKDKSKNFHVEPWQFDPFSQNMESIKLN